jgi:hypothetical protein
MFLAQIVLNGSLLRTMRHRECGRASEGTGKGIVADSNDAYTCCTADCASAGHTSGHLYLDWEVGSSHGGKSSNADSGNILSDLSSLESIWICSTRGRIDGSGEWTSSVLVNLVECHGDCTIGRTGWKAAISSCSGSLANTLRPL